MRRGRDGRATIATVAARAGRSISTVSAALNGSPGVAAGTRAEILRVAEELGYEADPRARLLRRRHTGLIGASFAVGQAFQGLLVDGLYQACSTLDHSLVLAASTPHRGMVEGLRGLLSERCEGLVLIDPDARESSLAQVVGSAQVVVVCNSSGLADVDEVVSRDDAGVTALVDHLVMSGRRRVVHVDGAGETAAAQRSRSYVAAMEQHGLGEEIRILPGGATEESGAQAVHALLEEAWSDEVRVGGCRLGRDQPDGAGRSGRRQTARAGRACLPEALLCFNDHCAVGALMELRRQGLRVPEDVAVTGYDGIPVTQTSSFSLTTVRQDAALLAEVAVRALLDRTHPGHQADLLAEVPAGVLRARRPQGGYLYSVMPSLVVRDTTAA